MFTDSIERVDTDHCPHSLPNHTPSSYPSLHKDKTHRIMFSAQIPRLAGRVTQTLIPFYPEMSTQN